MASIRIRNESNEMHELISILKDNEDLLQKTLSLNEKVQLIENHLIPHLQWNVQEDLRNLQRNKFEIWAKNKVDHTRGFVRKAKKSPTNANQSKESSANAKQSMHKLPSSHECLEMVHTWVQDNAEKFKKLSKFKSEIKDLFEEWMSQPSVPIEKQQYLSDLPQEDQFQWFWFMIRDLHYSKKAMVKKKAAEKKIFQEAGNMQIPSALKSTKPREKRRIHRHTTHQISTEHHAFDPLRRYLAENNDTDVRSETKMRLFEEILPNLPPERQEDWARWDHGQRDRYMRSTILQVRKKVVDPSRTNHKFVKRNVGDLNAVQIETCRERRDEKAKARLEARHNFLYMKEGKTCPELCEDIRQIPVTDSGGETMTIQQMADDPYCFVHFSYTHSSDGEVSRSLCRETNPMFVLKDGDSGHRAFTEREFHDNFEYVTVYEGEFISGSPFTLVEKHLQALFDHLALGKKGWRIPGSGRDYTDVSGYHRVFFVFSKTILGEVEDGGVKIRPTLDNICTSVLNREIWNGNQEYMYDGPFTKNHLVKEKLKECDSDDYFDRRDGQYEDGIWDENIEVRAEILILDR